MTVAVVDFGKYRRLPERYGTPPAAAVYDDRPIPSTNAPDREPVISATEPVHQGQGERSGMSASRRGAERDGCPYYRSLDRQNAVRRTGGQSIVLRVRMQLRRRSRERAM